ncbi:MAG: YhjD/YihY/BrkB family envelope integrity protein [Parvibaculum sp.]|nr:YhjD/YihY/BrkB family envelope integrity protein [Parvibaculum sp.]
MFLDPLFTRLRQFIWETPLDDLPFWRTAPIQAGQIAWVVGRDLLDGRLNLRAMSLVYTTLLSLVPTIAIAFAVFRAFGYAVYVQDFLARLLEPLGPQGIEITTRIMEFVDRVNANVLGTVGFAFLLYTVISMVKKIEAAFNDIWRVEASRSLARQFTEIVSMSVLGPIVLFTAIGIMAGVLSNAYIGSVIDFGPVKFLILQMSKIVPYLILIATFTFLYMMIPNTRVRFVSALVGATVAGVAWGIAGWAFATFVVRSAQYVAVYSAFASLVVFMIWLYAAWLILLIGCSITFYFQKRSHLSPSIGLAHLTPRQQQRMAVQALVLIHEAFDRGSLAWTDETLARRLHLPAESMTEIEALLTEGGFIARSDGQKPRLVPARPARLVRICDIVATLRQRRANGSVNDALLTRLPMVQEFFERVRDAENDILENTTIADLMQAADNSSANEAR